MNKVLFAKLTVILLLVIVLSSTNLAMADKIVHVEDEFGANLGGIVILIRYDDEPVGEYCWTDGDGFATRVGDPDVEWKALLDTTEWPIAPFTWVQGPVLNAVGQLNWVIE